MGNDIALRPRGKAADRAGRPKFFDFGVARTLDLEDATRATREGQIVGTVACTSSEQIAGRVDEVDTRSDVYALGVCTFELLAGELPSHVEIGVRLRLSEALAHRASYLEPGSPAQICIRHTLGKLRGVQGDWEGALAIFRSVREAWTERGFGEDSADLWLTRFSIGRCLLGLERWAEAKAELELHSDLGLGDGTQDALVALDAALTRFEAVDPTAHEVVMLRYFAGLGVDDTARALGLSVSTVKRE